MLGTCSRQVNSVGFDGLFGRVHVSFGVVTWSDEIDISSERLWTDCDPVGEDWRPRLLPDKYFA